MKIRIIAIFLLIGITQINMLNAKERTVKGKVTTFHKIALQKVSITFKDKDSELFTDENGQFTFSCDEKDKVTFKAHGFYSQKVKIADTSETDSLMIDLRFRNGKKNFEVATGYGHISEEKLTYAIEHLESGPDYSAYRNIFEILEGRFPGVSVSGNSINIRGTSTINSGPVPALLVVDGTIVEFPVFISIPPAEVKSIDILKGGAASARYGSRGMGGVVVVKTKSQN